jgi:DNA-binding beta-propeller fold protein YncE
MVVSSDGRYLYYFDVTTFQLGIVDLAAGPRMVGAVALENWSMSMVISPDDRLIYVAHPFNGYISVVDTSAWPAPVRKVPIDNGPFRLALSADGERLFVAQSGDSGSPGDLGTGTLSVIDTATLERQQVLTGDHSTDVTLNSTGTRAYVSNSGNPGTVSVVDVTGSPRVIATIAGFTYPSFVRLSADDTRLYVLDSATSPGIAVAAV